jgi:V/A-type H+/Na+-transporting ATPase subunit F
MFKMAAFGTEEFAMGFQLAGIKEIIVAADDPKDQICELIKSNDIGIVIIDEDTTNKLDEYLRHDIEDSVKPVFIMLSEKAEDESLRRMIRKSIGVDLWEK